MAIDNDRFDVASMIADHLKVPFDAAAAAAAAGKNICLSTDVYVFFFKKNKNT